MGYVITPETLPGLLRELDRRLTAIENLTGNQSINGSLTVLGGLIVGAAGTALTQIVVYLPSLTPASVPANNTGVQTFTVNGLTTADKVMVNGPGITVGVVPAQARVSAANTLEITFANLTGGPLTPAAGTYLVLAIRS